MLVREWGKYRSESPIERFILKLGMTAIIMLTEPLSPVLYVSISFIFFEINLVTKFFGIPYHHVIIYLHALAVK